MIFWLSLPHTQTQPQTGMKVNIVFGVVWGNLRKIMATFASEALRNRTRDRARPTSTLCKKHTTFFIANWVIKFIYTRRKATKKIKKQKNNPKRTLQNFRDFFFISGSNRFFAEDSQGYRLCACREAVSFFMTFHYNA